MVEKYIVSDDNKKILFVDNLGEIREIDNNELNLEIINLKNVIEKIEGDIGHILDSKSIVNTNLYWSKIFLIFELLMVAVMIAMSILTPIPLLLELSAIGTTLFLVFATFRYMSEQKRVRHKFSDRLNKKNELVSKYEEKLEELKQRVEDQENNKNNIAKRSFVYEFDPNLVQIETETYEDNPKMIKGFKKRTLTK